MDPAVTVGALDVPALSGDTNTPIEDPTLAGLLDFAGYLIKWALDTRLAQLQGPTTSDPITDACPEANRYPYNPETAHVRVGKPALFAWWQGPSRVAQWTMVYGKRERTIHLLYMFPETVLPNGMGARSGLLSIVDAVFAKLANEAAHPSYGYDGGAVGTPITQSLDLMRLVYEGGEASMAFEVPGNTTAAEQGRAGGQVQRGYPTLRGVFTVWERVGVSSGLDPEDVAGPLLATVRVNEQGDMDDMLTIKEGYMGGADGSEGPES